MSLLEFNNVHKLFIYSKRFPNLPYKIVSCDSVELLNRHFYFRLFHFVKFIVFIPTVSRILIDDDLPLFDQRTKLYDPYHLLS